MPYFQIPLSSENELFEVEIKGALWLLRARWSNAAESGWVLDWFDENNAAVALNVPLVTGADLCDGFEYLGLPSPLFVVGDDLPPSIDALGDSHYVVFFSET